ncbi:MAG: RNA polymerase sigma factor [Planctomycetota bacterium]|jgi:RNA polymerase sigma-70 factor (ECF subfamily)
MTRHTDEQLMGRVSSHDASAFEELVCRYQRRLFAFFWRLLSNAEEAQDCTQETFLRLWRGRTGYAPKGKFSTYLFQIAKNLFLDERRRHQRRPRLRHVSSDRLQGSAETPAEPDSPYREAVAREIRCAVSEAVARLPETHRLVYVMSEDQRMSYRQIAEILGCPVGTVSSRKVEAVRKLRKLLAPVWNESVGEDPRSKDPRAHGK